MYKKISSFLKSLVSFEYNAIVFGFKDTHGEGWKISLKEDDKGVLSKLSPEMSKDLSSAINKNQNFFIDDAFILNKNSLHQEVLERLSKNRTDEVLLDDGSIKLDSMTKPIKIRQSMYDEIHKEISRLVQNAHKKRTPRSKS